MYIVQVQCRVELRLKSGWNYAEKEQLETHMYANVCVCVLLFLDDESNADEKQFIQLMRTPFG